MTDATAAPVEETPATTATPSGEPTADAGKTAASATDAAKSAEASAPAKPGNEETDDVPELTALSKEERKTLGKALNQLDPEARKLYNRLLDGKFQETATERKAREAAEKKAADLDEYAKIISKIEEDPDGTIAALQARFPSKAKPNGKPAEVPEEMLKAVESTLDDASKPLAKVIAPAVMALVKQELQGVQEYVQREQAKAQEAQALAELQSFEKEFPDWKDFEPAMLEEAKKFKKSEGATNSEYLRALYRVASADSKAKAASKMSAEKILEKVARAAGNSEPDTTSVSPARVVKKPPSTVAEAFAQAKDELERGEVTA